MRPVSTGVCCEVLTTGDPWGETSTSNGTEIDSPGATLRRPSATTAAIPLKGDSRPRRPTTAVPSRVTDITATDPSATDGSAQGRDPLLRNTILIFGGVPAGYVDCPAFSSTLTGEPLGDCGVVTVPWPHPTTIDAATSGTASGA